MAQQPENIRHVGAAVTTPACGPTASNTAHTMEFE
jgi:hypothetical protein